MVVYPTHISGGSRTSRRRAPNRQNFLLGNFSKKKTNWTIEELGLSGSSRGTRPIPNHLMVLFQTLRSQIQLADFTNSDFVH